LPHCFLQRLYVVVMGFENDSYNDRSGKCSHSIVRVV